MRVAAVIPAAGRGTRLKSKLPKPFVPVLGKPLLVHTLERLSRSHRFEEMVVLVGLAHVGRARRLLKRHRLNNVRVVSGGVTRAESVRRGLLSLGDGSEWVLVHDAARPFVYPALVRRVLRAAKATGAALCAVPVTATVKRLRPARSIVSSTEDRSLLCLAQTPQVFRRKQLLSRYRALGARARGATDEAALFDHCRVAVRVVAGDAKNVKVTTPGDLELVEYYLRTDRRERRS